jgi:hydrogenase-4 component F
MMLPLVLVALPAVAALAGYVTPHRPARLGLLVGTAVAHTGLTGLLWARTNGGGSTAWLQVDALGLMVLTAVSLLFLATAFYAVGFLRLDRPRGGRIFVACLLAFLAACTLVALAHHLALLWIGMEATTLAIAPLVFHHRNRRSLEAVWKYLVLSSVGIGLALLGTFFLAAAQVQGRPLLLEDLVRHGRTLQPELLRAAFIFLLVGYGTKMGLAPLHSWKPDTYGEAPSLVAALMAGALTSCAFLGLARAAQIMNAAGQTAFIRPPLFVLGLASLVVAAAFMIGQNDLKRLLAYSSVEHMGLLVLALGLGGAGSYGAVLHLINNSLTKGLIFLAVGNVVLFYRTQEAAAIRGVLHRYPGSGVLLVAGLFAVTGSPPFGLFRSEVTILGAAIQEGYVWMAVAMVALLAVIFVGMARMILDLAWGDPGPSTEPPLQESGLLLAGPAALGALAVLLGVYLPGPLQAALRQAASALGGAAP